MPSPRAVLADIIDFGLDPAVPYKGVHASGRIAKEQPATDKDVQVNVPVVESVEVKLEPMMVVEPEELLAVESDPIGGEPIVFVSDDPKPEPELKSSPVHAKEPKTKKKAPHKKSGVAKKRIPKNDAKRVEKES